MSNLPPPPSFKPTIIQIKGNSNTTNDNYEISTSNPSYSIADDSLNSSSSIVTTRKRRRSSTNSSELEKRKKEHKAAHSIIEKKRRVKMNREFEALKYLVPACRNSNSSSLTAKGTASPASSASSNNGKIDGMYKLTILQASVEYIKYLHHIVSQQNAELKRVNPSWVFDDSFTKFNLNLNEYRDIEKEFNFHDLPKISSSSNNSTAANSQNVGVPSSQFIINDAKGAYLENINEERYEEYTNEYQLMGPKDCYQPSNTDKNSDPDSNASFKELGSNANSKVPIQLPTPEITPDISPIMTQLLKNSNLQHSPNSSPDQQRVLSNQQYLSLLSKLKFNLPDPMMNINENSLQRSNSLSNESHELPSFNTRNKSLNYTTCSSNKKFIENTSNDMSEEDLELINNADEASKALLLLKKTSIGSLLN